MCWRVASLVLANAMPELHSIDHPDNYYGLTLYEEVLMGQDALLSGT
ncbi:hypothetical protein yrohd0001_14460 [Yersinia rohdei ATCC 43380]|nr:hypothetical protein yrohd0001_14460 [Yersinia rohdei ATCC 43380]